VLDLKIDVLEVMNPGPANNNAICGHLPLTLQKDQNAQPNLSIIKGRLAGAVVKTLRGQSPQVCHREQNKDSTE
jgi:hypothetical protein